MDHESTTYVYINFKNIRERLNNKNGDILLEKTEKNDKNWITENINHIHIDEEEGNQKRNIFYRKRYGNESQTYTEMSTLIKKHPSYVKPLKIFR